jgi:hypothetical protein
VREIYVNYHDPTERFESLNDLSYLFLRVWPDYHAQINPVHGLEPRLVVKVDYDSNFQISVHPDNLLLLEKVLKARYKEVLE